MKKNSSSVVAGLAVMTSFFAATAGAQMTTAPDGLVMW